MQICMHTYMFYYFFPLCLIFLNWNLCEGRIVSSHSYSLLGMTKA